MIVRIDSLINSRIIELQVMCFSMVIINSVSPTISVLSGSDLVTFMIVEWPIIPLAICWTCGS
jgi:hypothetical protein